MDDNRKKLEEKITDWRNQRYKGQKIWSSIHHTSRFGSVISSIGAGVVLQIYQDMRLATIFTLLAAALAAIASTGGAENKWIRNRLSRCTADCLLVDLLGEAPNQGEIGEKFKAAMEEHDKGIISADKIENA